MQLELQEQIEELTEVVVFGNVGCLDLHDCQGYGDMYSMDQQLFDTLEGECTVTPDGEFGGCTVKATKTK